jgi:hypothetical protein
MTKSDRPQSRPPGSGRDSSAHLHAALSASGRAEASLSTLMRAIRDLSSGVSSAREANVQLLRELEAMSDLLGAANERQLALKNRVALLEQSLERAHVEAQRERAYILDQQDAFIAAMMDDHEQVIAELYRELEATRLRPSQRASGFTTLPNLAQVAVEPSDDTLRHELEEAKATIEKLLGERDRARETLLKVQAQRDEAQAALVDRGREPSRASQARMAAVIPSGIPAPHLRNAPTLPPPEAARPVLPAPDAPPSASSTAPTIPPPVPVPSSGPSARELDHGAFPPEELRGAVHPPPSSGGQALRAAMMPKRSLTPPGPPSDLPPQNSASGRPGGYSMTNSVAPEHVAGAPRVSRAPRSS